METKKKSRLRAFFDERWRFEPKGKPKKQRVLLAVFSWALLLCAAICLGLVSLYFATLTLNGERFYFYFENAWIPFLNILPVVLLAGILYAATARAWLAFLLDATVVMLLTLINFFKAQLRSECLLFEDILLTGEAAGVLGEYTIRFTAPIFLAVGLCLAGTFVLWFFARHRVKGTRLRFSLSILLFGALLFSYQTWYTSDELYQSIRAPQRVFSPWRMDESYAMRGFFWPFLYSLEDAFPERPEGYSTARAEEVLSRYESEDIPEEQRVNVQVLMLESFSDFSATGTQFAVDPYKEFHELEAECYHGMTISDYVGGGTAYVERAAITGFSYPMLAITAKTDSIAYYFKSQGYYTSGSHPSNNWFYSREGINRDLGFDDYYFAENHYAPIMPDPSLKTDFLNGNRLCDELFFGELRKIFDEMTQDGQPHFWLDVSIQNHGPYDRRDYEGDVDYIASGSISEEGYHIANNYFSGIADTGKQLKAYVDSYRDTDEPIVLLIFGDHRPLLGESGSVMRELGAIGNTKSAYDNLLGYYSTPYLIWANDAAKALLGRDFSGEGETISSFYLMTELFDACGWKGSAYLQYLRDLRDKLPVMYRSSQYVDNGRVVYSLSDELQALRDEYDIVKYYMQQHLRGGA